MSDTVSQFPHTGKILEVLLPITQREIGINSLTGFAQSSFIFLLLHYTKLCMIDQYYYTLVYSLKVLMYEQSYVQE